MNKTVEMLAVAATACATAIAAPQQAALKQATVFLTGAELQHEAIVTLQKGENEVTIEGISPVIDRSSLQVSIGGGVVISSFEFSTDYLSADKQNQNTQQLTDQLEAKQKELKQVETKLETTQQMTELLQTGVEHSMSVERQAITSEQIEKNLTYYEQRVSKLASQKAELTKQKEDLTKEINRLKQQIRQDGMQGAKRTGVLKLALNSPQAGKTKVAVKYFTQQAHWTPFYDLNVAEVGSPIDFVMKARVGQTTGLDWEKVRLTLSTGTPSKSNNIPSFSTWYLRKHEEIPYPTAARSNTMLMRKSAMPEPLMDMAVAEEYEEEADMMVGASKATVEDYVWASEQTLSVDYAIDLPYTILGNGKEQTIGLRTIEAKDVAYKYVTVPKLDGAVYLTAEITNWRNLGLLNGTANLTFAGTYFGQTEINTEQTNEAIRLTLGQDAQISVKREQEQDFSKKAGVLGSNTSVVKAYKTTIRNNKKQAITLVVQDQYPVSTNEQIQVELTDKTTRWQKRDADRGILTYEIELQAGEAKEIVVAYQVKYPKDWTVDNLR